MSGLPRNGREALGLAQLHDARLDGRDYLRASSGLRIRHAVEMHHESFVAPAFAALLRRHKVPLVVADTAGPWPLIEDITADFVYVRLHGDQQLYSSVYSDDLKHSAVGPVGSFCLMREDHGHNLPSNAAGASGAVLADLCPDLLLGRGLAPTGRADALVAHVYGERSSLAGQHVWDLVWRQEERKVWPTRAERRAPLQIALGNPADARSVSRAEKRTLMGPQLYRVPSAVFFC